MVGGDRPRSWRDEARGAVEPALAEGLARLSSRIGNPERGGGAERGGLLRYCLLPLARSRG
jgi:hypothetical protein